MAMRIGVLSPNKQVCIYLTPLCIFVHREKEHVWFTVANVRLAEGYKFHFSVHFASEHVPIEIQTGCFCGELNSVGVIFLSE